MATHPTAETLGLTTTIEPCTHNPVYDSRPQLIAVLGSTHCYTVILEYRYKYFISASALHWRFLLENVMCEISEDEAAKYYLIKGFEAHFETLKRHMMLMDYNDLSESIQNFTSTIMNGECDV